MQDFLREGFVLSDELQFAGVPGDGIQISGTIRCLGGIVLEVDKQLAVLSGVGANAVVQTVAYRYHAQLPGRGSILRYDSPHPSHNQFHHVHRYDWFRSWEETCVTRIDNEDAIPTLSDVLDELRDFYYAYVSVIQQRIDRAPA